jgi:hypothetical protein
MKFNTYLIFPFLYSVLAALNLIETIVTKNILFKMGFAVFFCWFMVIAIMEAVSGERKFNK